MSAQPKLSFSDTDKLLQMSLILKAIDDCNQELTEYKANHKARLESLHGELSKLRWEVLSGQERLPLEPIPASNIVPCEVSPDKESSVEEIRRTRRTKTEEKSSN
jgi:hypothetical protein